MTLKVIRSTFETSLQRYMVQMWALVNPKYVDCALVNIVANFDEDVWIVQVATKKSRYFTAGSSGNGPVSHGDVVRWPLSFQVFFLDSLCTHSKQKRRGQVNHMSRNNPSEFYPFSFFSICIRINVSPSHLKINYCSDFGSVEGTLSPLRRRMSVCMNSAVVPSVLPIVPLKST